MGNITDGSYDLDADGKYLLISVPKFKQDPISGKEMTSYLRLGASSSTWQQDPGGDLAGQVALAGPSGGPVTPNATPVSPTGDDPRPVFIDDLRVREGSPGPHNLSVDERLEQSAVLHTRGGWRDHSDGNRISTTYGDKIEVIRGNYKMVVLGRQDDESKAAGLDLSGQHLQTYAYTNPSLLRISWTQDLGGTWHIEEASEGVVHSVNFAGDEYEFKWGDRFESTTGSEAPMATDPATGGPRLNPKIIEKTWATSIASYTGSAALPVPTITEETWADTITSTTTAASTTETTNVTAISSTTTATTITDVTTAASISGVTTAANISDVTTAATIDEFTTVGLLTETWIGNKVGRTVGTTTEVFVGNKAAASLALSEELKVGGIIDIAIAAALEVFLGYKCEVNMGPRTNISLTLDTCFDTTRLKLSGTNTDMHGVGHEIGPRFFF